MGRIFLRRLTALLVALGLHAGAVAQPVDKDPLDYSLRQYGIVLIFALLGGLVSWVSKVRAGTAMPAARGMRRVVARKNAQGLVIGGTVMHADGTTEALTVERTEDGGLEIVIGSDEAEDAAEKSTATRRKAPRKKE